MLMNVIKFDFDFFCIIFQVGEVYIDFLIGFDNDIFVMV